MSFFRFLRHHHDRHHGHHGHHHADHFGHGGPGFDEASRIEYMADKVSSRLDLNDEQQQRLHALLTCLQEQRASIKNGDIAKEVGTMIQGEKFARDAAKTWIDQRLQALQTAAPIVLTALADFYDSLDTEQQQALRFLLRMRGRFGGGRHGRGKGWSQ
ncbi:MAG TPA: Spy/CpxP family protein refolding chaperone [Burkholderiaceae bacterium]